MAPAAGTGSCSILGTRRWQVPDVLGVLGAVGDLGTTGDLGTVGDRGTIGLHGGTAGRHVGAFLHRLPLDVAAGGLQLVAGGAGSEAGEPGSVAGGAGAVAGGFVVVAGPAGAHLPGVLAELEGRERSSGWDSCPTRTFCVFLGSCLGLEWEMLFPSVL